MFALMMDSSLNAPTLIIKLKKNFLNITLKSWNWPGISGPLNKQYPPFGVSRTKLLGHSPLPKLLTKQLVLKVWLTADEMT